MTTNPAGDTGTPRRGDTDVRRRFSVSPRLRVAESLAVATLDSFYRFLRPYRQSCLPLCSESLPKANLKTEVVCPGTQLTRGRLLILRDERQPI